MTLEIILHIGLIGKMRHVPGFVRAPRINISMLGCSTHMSNFAENEILSLGIYFTEYTPRQQKFYEMNGAHLASPIRGDLGYAHWPHLGSQIHCHIGNQIWGPLGKED